MKAIYLYFHAGYRRVTGYQSHSREYHMVDPARQKCIGPRQRLPTKSSDEFGSRQMTCFGSTLCSSTLMGHDGTPSLGPALTMLGEYAHRVGYDPRLTIRIAFPTYIQLTDPPVPISRYAIMSNARQQLILLCSRGTLHKNRTQRRLRR